MTLVIIITYNLIKTTSNIPVEIVCLFLFISSLFHIEIENMSPYFTCVRTPELHFSYLFLGSNSHVLVIYHIILMIIVQLVVVIVILKFTSLTYG